MISKIDVGGGFHALVLRFPGTWTDDLETFNHEGIFFRILLDYFLVLYFQSQKSNIKLQPRAKDKKLTLLWQYKGAVKYYISAFGRGGLSKNADNADTHFGMEWVV